MGSGTDRRPSRVGARSGVGRSRVWLLCCCIVAAAGASPLDAAPPIFDVHLHALAADAQGPPPLAMCTPFVEFPAWDPQQPYAQTFAEVMKEPPCEHPIWSPTTDQGVFDRTLAVMEKLNVYGVLSGTSDRVESWMRAAPGRFVPGLGFNVARGDVEVDWLREQFETKRVQVLAEVTNQYAGIAPDDERMEPFWALAEELDVPVGIHVGNGPPGVRYLGSPGYAAQLHSALTMEPVLVRHPKLRVYLMHAGYPMLDDLLALLYTHPQVHVGLGVISYTTPTPAYYRFLRGIVEAGFANRILFGSDQMVWPETIEYAVQRILDAPFLSQAQKRAVLYENAARFFRFDDATRARHHATSSP